MAETTPAGGRERVRVAGREMVVTNLDKVMYPETGTTKADVLAYYAAVAPVLIPAAANRPATRKRWVHGVGTADAPGEMFFQKNLDHSTPGWVPRASITHKDRTIQYPLVNDPATLAWLAQIAALEIHVPQWRVDSHGNQMPPDRLVLDLDPGEGAGLAECVEVAKLARTILQDVGLEPVPVTSGSKGIHLYAALDGTQSSEQISDFAHELARSLEADHPELAVSDMKKTLRTGKVLVDWSQNNAAKTTIVPYSLRGRLRPTVAAPRTWRELSSPSLHQLDYQEVLQRVKDGKDPFAAISGGKRTGHEPAERAQGRRSDGPGDGGDTDPRLESYRTKRDSSATPEPFTAERHRAGTEGAEPDGGTLRETFVIQEHHASRLHFDLRLERDGVLVSWALPKGVPTSKTKNHLAVQTEDHPLDYLDFEGTIPKGQYGAGTMSIWDRGYYEVEKWVAGKEVIATLTGRDDGGLGGARRFALIHTGRGDDQWLIHLMDPLAAKVAKKGQTAPPPDDEADATTAPGGDQPAALVPEDFQPMLASAGTISDLPDKDWQFELKWDGVRALIIGDAKTIRLISRNGNDMSAAYPELTDRACWPEQDFIADGEIIAVGPSGRPDFGLLQGRMKLTQGRRRREGAGVDAGAADAVRPPRRARQGPPPSAAQQAPGTAGSVLHPLRLPGGALRADRRRYPAHPGKCRGAGARGRDGQAHGRPLRRAAQQVLAQAQVRTHPGGGGRRLAAGQGRARGVRGLAPAGDPGRIQAALRGARGQRLQRPRTTGTAPAARCAAAEDLAVQRRAGSRRRGRSLGEPQAGRRGHLRGMDRQRQAPAPGLARMAAG